MTDKKIEENKITLRFQAIKPTLNEKALRIWAASEAKAYGWGGIALVSKITKMSNRTIHKGLKELEDQSLISSERIRRKGAGRKKFRRPPKGIKKQMKEFVIQRVEGI